MMKRATIATVTLALLAGAAWAKLPAPPPLNDEQKAKAEEAKAKATEAAKKEAALLAKYQDRAADNYKKGQGRARAAPAPAKQK